MLTLDIAVCGAKVLLDQVRKLAISHGLPPLRRFATRSSLSADAAKRRAADVAGPFTTPSSQNSLPGSGVELPGGRQGIFTSTFVPALLLSMASLPEHCCTKLSITRLPSPRRS